MKPYLSWLHLSRHKFRNQLWLYIHVYRKCLTYPDIQLSRQLFLEQRCPLYRQWHDWNLTGNLCNIKDKYSHLSSMWPDWDLNSNLCYVKEKYSHLSSMWPDWDLNGDLCNTATCLLCEVTEKNESVNFQKHLTCCDMQEPYIYCRTVNEHLYWSPLCIIQVHRFDFSSYS